MITIYTITYNEQQMLPHFIKHYRNNFPGCRIIVYDNYSTDATVRIALAADCEVISYNSNNQLDDLKYLQIKNHCWQGQQDTWAIVADCDELLQITEEELEKEEIAGTTIVSTQGYDMVNMLNNTDIASITKGAKNDRYSKSYCFNTKRISAINYTPGCHEAKPVGSIAYSFKVYPAYHYRFISVGYLNARYIQNKLRMCENNKRKGMGSQYFQTEAQIKAEIEAARQQSQKVREPMPDNGLKIFITYYQHEQIIRIPKALHINPINLSQLLLKDNLQDNRLSEHRLFLSDLMENESTPYIGNLTWRWFQKNRHLIPLDTLWQLYRTPDVVWAAWPDNNWYRKSCMDHKGIQKYLNELIDFTGMQHEGTGLLANQFICSLEVYKDFEAFFRKCFEHFHTKYGFEGFDFEVQERDRNRLPAVFYERITALYFANRKDLIIKQIPNR